MMKKLVSVLLAALLLVFASCGGSSDTPSGSESPKAPVSGVEDGVLTVAMECAYAPYNWSQPDDSNGAVPIKDSALFANGYDVMTAKAICEANNWKLEIVQLDWDSLIPAVQSGTVDCVIAGQSMTADRLEEVDFAGPYLYASIVCLTKKGSAYEKATCLNDLSGGTCTSQSGTIWYSTCLPQIPDAKINPPMESAPAMLMALESGTVDFVCTDMPTAQGALIAYDDFVLLDFANGEGNFTVSDEEINIGISVRKGNTELADKINAYFTGKTADDFNDLMNEAIKIQPIEK